MQQTTIDWIKMTDQEPPEETPLLVRHKSGNMYEAYVTWERPGFEDTFQAFKYIIDIDERNCDWDFTDITHWAIKPVIK